MLPNTLKFLNIQTNCNQYNLPESLEVLYIQTQISRICVKLPKNIIFIYTEKDVYFHGDIPNSLKCLSVHYEYNINDIKEHQGYNSHRNKHQLIPEDIIYKHNAGHIGRVPDDSIVKLYTKKYGIDYVDQSY